MEIFLFNSILNTSVGKSHSMVKEASFEGICRLMCAKFAIN